MDSSSIFELTLVDLLTLLLSNTEEEDKDLVRSRLMRSGKAALRSRDLDLW